MIIVIFISWYLYTDKPSVWAISYFVFAFIEVFIQKKIGIVGYWATSISTVSTTVLSEKVLKTDLFPDLDITFRILDI